jgi:dTDP-4-amino-4,6-dideoxygalactose transaminase
MNSAAPTTIPLTSPLAENQRNREELLAAAARVIDSGYYILGSEVAAFEAELAASLGVSGAVGVGSGTDALVLALQAIGVGRGDEVIIPSHTAGPTAAAVAFIGAVPVLADVAPGAHGLDAASVKVALSERTKAIIFVHLYGGTAGFPEVLAVAQAHGVALIEDCAQSQGADIGGKPVGSLGTVGCFSFYPTKNLGAIGDGGAVVSSDEALLDRVRRLRTYGWTRPQYAELAGGQCSRLDELQAAFLRVKLRGLGRNVQRRREIARHYIAGLRGLPVALPEEPAGTTHAYHLFVIRTPDRDALAAHLKTCGVMTGLHYPYAIHQQPAFMAVAKMPASLAETDALIPEILSLPMYADLTDGQAERVIAAVRGFFA